MSVRNLQTVKRSNRVTVLDFIRQFEPISRNQIARDLSLSPTTASSAVSDLIDARLVREIGHGQSTGGRRPILLEIDPKGGTILSVDVSSIYGQRVLKAAALDFKGNILTNIRREQQINDNASMRAAIRSVIDDLINSHDVKLRDAVALGVSVPGLVNSKTGELVYAAFNVRHLALGAELTNAFKMPVLVQNNEDAAALGEHRFGVGQGSTSLVYLSMGEGVGSGFVLNGQIYNHGRSSAGELGHITVQVDGPPCECGNRGCLTKLVSSRAIVQEIEAALAAGYEPTSEAELSSPTTIHAIMESAENGDPLCQQVVDKTAQWAGIAVATMINLLNPETIVFGGELFEENDYFLSVVERYTRQRMLQTYASVRLVRSQLGRRAGLQGVAALALDTLFQTPAT